MWWSSQSITSEPGWKTYGINILCFLLIRSVTNFAKYPESTGLRGVCFVLMNLKSLSKSIYLPPFSSSSGSGSSFFEIDAWVVSFSDPSLSNISVSFLVSSKPSSFVSSWTSPSTFFSSSEVATLIDSSAAVVVSAGSTLDSGSAYGSATYGVIVSSVGVASWGVSDEEGSPSATGSIALDSSSVSIAALDSSTSVVAVSVAGVSTWDSSLWLGA